MFICAGLSILSLLGLYVNNVYLPIRNKLFVIK
nr:MAG TPA: hypothetical protein [Caudoviricetes sp.]